MGGRKQIACWRRQTAGSLIRHQSQYENRHRYHVERNLLPPDQGSRPILLKTETSVTVKLNVPVSMAKTSGLEQTRHVNRQLQLNEATEQGSTQGWPERTATL